MLVYDTLPYLFTVYDTANCLLLADSSSWYIERILYLITTFELTLK